VWLLEWIITFCFAARWRIAFSGMGFLGSDKIHVALESCAKLSNSSARRVARIFAWRWNNILAWGIRFRFLRRWPHIILLGQVYGLTFNCVRSTCSEFSTRVIENETQPWWHKHLKLACGFTQFNFCKVEERMSHVALRSKLL